MSNIIKPKNEVYVPIPNKGDTYSDNTSQNYITTTEDKLRLCLGDFSRAVKEGGDWVSALGLVITLVPTYLGAEFKTEFYISADTWKAIWQSSAIISIMWLGKTVFRVILSHKERDLEKLIQKIKTGNADPAARLTWLTRFFQS